MLLAVVCAAGMWYWVTQVDRIEAQIDVTLDYTGVPSDLIVTGGQDRSIRVRLRGPENILRNLPKENLRHTINLSQIKAGENQIPFGNHQLPDLRAFDIIDIVPSRLDITADKIVEKRVNINHIVKSPLQNDALIIEDVSSYPSTVILKGPEKTLAGRTGIDVSIIADPNQVGKPQHKTITLDTPNLVIADPPSVDIYYTITSGRVSLTRDCPILIATTHPEQYEINPKAVTVKIIVPDALAKNADYLKQLVGRITPPDMQTGQTLRVTPRYDLPEGMVFDTPPDRVIAITKIGEN